LLVDCLIDFARPASFLLARTVTITSLEFASYDSFSTIVPSRIAVLFCLMLSRTSYAIFDLVYLSVTESALASWTLFETV